MSKRKGNKKYRNKNKKESSGASKFYKGKLDVNRSGSGFVSVEGFDRDVKILSKNLKSALNGDEVKLKILSKKSHGRVEGKVVDVLERKSETFVGTIQLHDDFAFLATSKGSQPDIYIDRKYLSGVKDGDKAVVKILDWGNSDLKPSGKVIAILDKGDSNDSAMKEILIESGFPLSFPKEVKTQAQSLKEDFGPNVIKKRRDLREVFTITIDPADAKDFDDAISIKKMDQNLFEVGVHIADVSHYVTAGSDLDKEAYNRGTSVYLPDRVIPMLPEVISNNLCSLRPNEEKLTFSVIFTMTGVGKVKKSWIGRTVIRSDYRYAYEDAQRIIDTKKGENSQAILALYHISANLRKERMQRGAINFSSKEVRFKLDENAVPIGIEIKESKEANQLIEELMLLANRTVATYASSLKVKNKVLPFPYRVHDVPDEDKLATYVAFAARMGYKFDTSSPQAIATSFNEMLDRVQGKPEQAVLEQLGIRTMAKAKYTTENIGHYGLGFENYCHFTSPIRRYPDIMVHRIIAAALDKKMVVEKGLEDKCAHCSDREKKAQEAERAGQKYKQVEYMQQYIGEDFDAVISGVAGFGFWAETVETKCEGLIPVSELETIDHFVYIESEYALRGTHTGLAFKMGDTIRIKVVAANLEKRQLDYELVETKEKKNGRKQPNH